MGRLAADVNHLAFSVAKVLQKETGTLGQVPTVGCQPGGLRMHVWYLLLKTGSGSALSGSEAKSQKVIVQTCIT